MVDHDVNCRVRAWVDPERGAKRMLVAAVNVSTGTDVFCVAVAVQIETGKA